MASKSTTLIPLLTLFLIQFASTIVAHGGGGDDDDDATPDAAGTTDLHSRSLILVKVWCLIILFASTFAGGVSPYFYRWNEAFLLLGTQFAGGVFLGTALMHFLSDSTETFGDLTGKTYPFSFMLACSGYLLTMLGDCVIRYVVGGADREVWVGLEEGRMSSSGTAGRGQKEEVNAYFVKTTSFSDTVLLILALCFHSVFEGIAVGVAANKSDAWTNMWTISLHKIFAAIAMGIALLKMIPKRPFLTTVAYSFAFAISSPVGVGIGIALDATSQGREADWTYAISMGLACGVFVYVAINHLMGKGFKPQEKNYFDAPFYKFLAVLLGVGTIAVVMIWD